MPAFALAGIVVFLGLTACGTDPGFCTDSIEPAMDREPDLRGRASLTG